MKPRTKVQKIVSELSNKLSEIANVHKRWAAEHLFAHEAYKCKNELWCSDCGGVWIDSSNSELGVIVLGDSTECPYCHHKLKVKVSRKKKSTDEVYMSILQVVEGFQVIRHVLCCKYACKKTAYPAISSHIRYSFLETVQEWITVDGKRIVMAKPMNMGSNGWIYSEPLSIKN